MHRPTTTARPQPPSHGRLVEGNRAVLNPGRIAMQDSMFNPKALGLRSSGNLIAKQAMTRKRVAHLVLVCTERARGKCHRRRGNMADPAQGCGHRTTIHPDRQISFLFGKAHLTGDAARHPDAGHLAGLALMLLTNLAGPAV